MCKRSAHAKLQRSRSLRPTRALTTTRARFTDGRDDSQLTGDASIDAGAGSGLESGLHHAVKRPDIFTLTLSQAAVDLDRWEQPVAVDVQSQSGEFLAGIGFDAPLAAETTPNHFTQITAPYFADFAYILSRGLVGRHFTR